MFAARGIAVSFSMFFLLYSGLSVVVATLWAKVWLHRERCPAWQCADLLFAIRMLPLAISLAVTFAFTVPSFMLLEPHAIREPVGAISLVLGLCGLILVLLGILNATAAVLAASRTIATWVGDGLLVKGESSVPVLRISRVVPALTAAGIFRPLVLMSDAVETVLNASELRSALRHELAHVRRRDNLKKLLLRFVVFPGMSALEVAWLQATEIAADDAAVSTASEALDLAAALIKLSRLATLPSAPDIATTLVHAPLALVNARIERLIAWNGQQNKPTLAMSPLYTVCLMVTTVAAVAVTYSQALVGVHTATEWLVR
jgi:beta-lactamase regulating signal transducer with metallopeptidase domain